jgi:hypothetical protein
MPIEAAKLIIRACANEIGVLRKLYHTHTSPKTIRMLMDSTGQPISVLV